MIMGVKIRTMWMTPFYLFFGVLVIYIFQSQINLDKLKGFASVFAILFILPPFAYAYVSITETDKRTDYPGKEIAKKVQETWESSFSGEIELVFGNEWRAGNLSYHLKSRPKWKNKISVKPKVGYVIIGNAAWEECYNELTRVAKIIDSEKEYLLDTCLIGKK